MNQFTEAKEKSVEFMMLLISSIENADSESSKIAAVSTYSQVIKNMALGENYHSLLDDVDVRKYDYDAEDVYESIRIKPTWRNGEPVKDSENDIRNGIYHAVLFIESIHEWLAV